MIRERHPQLAHLLRYTWLAAAASAVVTALGGCGLMRDAVAWAVGAPSSQQIEEQEHQIREHQRAVEDLEAELDQARRLAAAAEQHATATEGRKQEVRALYGEMAGQLTRLDGAAADSMLESLDYLRRQVHAFEAERRGALEIVAAYQARIAGITAAQTEAGRLLREAHATLDAYMDRTEIAISAAVGGAQAIGYAVADLGLPAARAATDTITGTLRTGLELLLLGGGAGATLLARGRARQRDAEQRRRLNLTRIVQANDQVGLIKDDEQLRDAAKQIAGADAVRELQLARATVIAPAQG